MSEFGGLESFRFIPRGVEVNGKDFVPANELRNCQEARERVVLAHSKAWDEIMRLRGAIRDYAGHQPLDLKGPAEIQGDLLAIANGWDFGGLR